MSLSIVLPCFNEREAIAQTVHAVSAWMKCQGHQGEIIVVNDGSTDSTAEVLAKLASEIPHLHIITHERNLGYGLAVRSGCDAGTCATIAFMDSDGQFDPHDFRLLLPVLKDCAFVTGRRRHRADPPLRNLFGKILGIMDVVVFGVWVRDINCGMKAFRRSIWPAIRPTIALEKLFNTEIFLYLKRHHIAWQQVDVPHYPRQFGQPTGGTLTIIFKMFKEVLALFRRARGHQ